jgi:hypothetical protein
MPVTAGSTSRSQQQARQFHSTPIPKSSPTGGRSKVSFSLPKVSTSQDVSPQENTPIVTADMEEEESDEEVEITATRSKNLGSSSKSKEEQSTCKESSSHNKSEFLTGKVEHEEEEIIEHIYSHHCNIPIC